MTAENTFLMAIDILDAIRFSAVVQLTAELTLTLEALRHELSTSLTLELGCENYIRIHDACLTGSIIIAVCAVIKRYIA